MAQVEYSSLFASNLPRFQTFDTPASTTNHQYPRSKHQYSHSLSNMSSSNARDTYTNPSSPPSTARASAHSQAGTTSSAQQPSRWRLSSQPRKDRKKLQTEAIDSLKKLRDTSEAYRKIRHQLDSGFTGHITPWFQGISKEHEESKGALSAARADFIKIVSQIEAESAKTAVLQEAKDKYGVTNAQELWEDADTNNSLQSQSHNGV